MQCGHRPMREIRNGLVNSSYKKTVPDFDKEPTVIPITYSDAKYNRLVKVADRVDDHDAVTVGQLKSSTSQLESTVGQLESTVGQLLAVGTNLDTKVNKATASSYVFAALHPNFSGDETGLGVAVGFGYYHGKTATALGAFYRPSRNVQFNVGAVFGNGNAGFNGRLSFKVESESKGTSTSIDARIAELERQILELE